MCSFLKRVMPVLSPVLNSRSEGWLMVSTILRFRWMCLFFFNFLYCTFFNEVFLKSITWKTVIYGWTLFDVWW